MKASEFSTAALTHPRTRSSSSLAFCSFVRFSPLARLGGIFLTPLLRVPGICHAARACGGPWGRVVDPDGLLGKAPGAGPCEVVSVAAALRLAGWLLGWLPADRTLPFLAL